MCKRVGTMWRNLDKQYKAAIIGGVFALLAALIAVNDDVSINDDDSVKVGICLVNEDAQGDDNYNLNGEWVKICNTGDQNEDMTGWKLHDDDGHVYRFPFGFVLEKGKSVTIYTGSGEDAVSELYWGCSRSVWTNTGDCAYLVDKQGNEADHYCW